MITGTNSQQAPSFVLRIKSAFFIFLALLFVWPYGIVPNDSTHSLGFVNVAAAAGEHDYFNALVARPEHWKSYSLRSSAQLDYPKNGGYASGNSDPLNVTYNPANDLNPNRQDAAKVVIPPFGSTSSVMLHQPLNSTSLVMYLSDLDGDVTKVATALNVKGKQLKIGNEVIVLDRDKTPLNRTTGVVTLSERGAYGTTAASYSVGERLYNSTNSLSNQIRVPVDTHDGARWLFTWDGFFTDSYFNTGIGNYKSFQLSSPSNDIWLEPNIHFDGGGSPSPAGFDRTKHVGVTGRVRSYNTIGGNADYSLNGGDNKLGPGVTDNAPIAPTEGDFFIVHPNRWVRWWVQIDQRANDYDLFSMWIADEQNNARQIYDNIPVSVGSANGVSTIDKFYVEFNTSTGYLPEERTTDFRDLVAYVKNIVVLKNPPADVTSIMQRPGSGGTLPPPVVDSTPPTVSLSAPAANATLTGTVTLSANASDNVGVAGVQFKLNGTNIGSEDTSAPYSVNWNSATMANGAYTLTAVARDFAGNTTTSTSRTVTLNNSVIVPPPPPATNILPEGSFDSISSSGVAKGWAYDPDSPELPSDIHVYVDGPAGSGKSPIATFDTDVLRTDVNSLKSIDGEHGFEYSIPTSLKDGRAHSMYIYAIDSNDSNKSTLLTGSPKNFTISSTTITPPPVDPPPPPVVKPTVIRQPRGTLVNHNGTIYFLGTELKYPFPSAEVFLSWGVRFNQVVPANSADIKMPTGPIVQYKTPTETRHPRGTLVNYNGTIYFLGTELKYPFPSAEVFLSWGVRFDQVVPANSGDIAMPLGPIVQRR